MRKPDEVGIYIREVLRTSPGLTNETVADMVVIKFPDRTFDATALRQRIANTKFVQRREQRIVE